MANKAEVIKISKDEARHFLARHHFLSPARSLGKSDIVPVLFSRFGCIQFDTINVVGRNADLVLQSRIKNYKPEILDSLLYEDRLLTDGWDKVASIYRVVDWPYFERHRAYMSKYHNTRSPELAQVFPRVLDAIKKEGPMSSIDFKDDSRTDWAWGPTSLSRAALETLYAQGNLGIHHRVNTRRYFDLIERLFPEDILMEDDPNRSAEDYEEWHIHRRIGGVGIASPKSGEHWLGIQNGRKVTDRKKILNRLIEKGKIITLEIEELQKQTYYIQSDSLQLLNSIMEEQSTLSNSAAFIAPLDNLIWNRGLVREIFDFQYVWEVYKPKKSRSYGYYVLPVFYRNAFIARVDLQFDRKTKCLILNNWWWENNVKQTSKMRQAIKVCFQAFISYLGANSFRINKDSLTTDLDQTLLP